MKQAEIKGIIPAILTPMNEDESVNPEVLRQQIDRLIEGGVHGLFPFAQTVRVIFSARRRKLRFWKLRLTR